MRSVDIVDTDLALPPALLGCDGEVVRMVHGELVVRISHFLIRILVRSFPSLHLISNAGGRLRSLHILVSSLRDIGHVASAVVLAASGSSASCVLGEVHLCAYPDLVK